MENASKSIIYGNSYSNKYGRFMPICSSITDRSSIMSILDYLKDSPHFRKYNRITYAYRVEQAPIVFITEKKNVDPQYYEGAHSDETIEGSGEKLLHLLEKFNIRNVVIAVLVEQFNPLLPFETANYRAIVENSRLLLDELYKKVATLQEKVETRSMNDLLLHDSRAVKLKKYNILEGANLPQETAPKAVKDRPNHIYAMGKPNFVINKPPVDNTSYEVGFLWERSKLMKEQFEKVLATIEEKEIEQLHYFVMYDKNLLINSVIKMLAAHEGLTKEQMMKDYDFNQIKKFKFEALENPRLRQLEDFLKTNKKLTVDNVMKANRAVGVVFSLLEIKVRFSKTLKRITQLLNSSDLPQRETESLKVGNDVSGGSLRNA